MDKRLLVLSLLGVLVLIFIINVIEPKEVNLKEIEKMPINSLIKVSGNINNLVVYESNFTTFNLVKQNNSIKVVCNCNNLDENKKIIVLGRITKYNNIMQIEAETIKIFI